MNNLTKLAILSLILGLFACTETVDREAYALSVKKAEDALYADNKTFQMQPAKVDSLVMVYIGFASAFPKDSSTPEYLLKAADLHRFGRKSEEALALYQRVYNDFPDFDKRAYCLFLQGFVYENDLAEMDKAKTTYEQFLEEYADHELADDVQFSLKNLGKSPEDIIKEFEQQNQSMLDSAAAS